MYNGDSLWFYRKNENIMDFEWVIQPMVCSTLYDFGHRRNHQKTWRFQWECMGISSNFCWWIFQQAMELITMNLTRRFCYDWIYRTIKYIKIRIIDLDSSVSQTLGIPHFMVIFMWIMIIIPKKHRVCAIFRQTQMGVYPVRMLGDGSWVYHTIITFECIEPRMGSWHINKYYVYKVRLPRQLSWFVTPLGFMAVVTIVGWVYKNFTNKDIWGTTFYQLLRLTSRAFNGRRISLDIFLVKKTLCKGKSTHFLWVNPLFQWPFSRAFC